MLAYNVRKTHKHKSQKMTTLKVIAAAAIGTAGAFLAPISSYLIAVGVLVFADQFTGMWAAVKRGERITSKAMRATIEKTIFYFIAILLSEVMRVVFMTAADVFPLTFIVASYIGIREFWSCLENISEITGTDIIGGIADKLPDGWRRK